jgi:hypothetical protein
VEHLDGATKITLTGPKRSGENLVAKELKGLTGDLGQTHLVLDFARVPYLTSVELATLIRLHKKMKGSGGG